MSEAAVQRDMEFEDAEEKGRQLPDPVGYKILCAVPELDNKYEGSVIERPDVYAKREAQATVVLFVMKMGPDCYTDKTRYPTGPWCRVGDFIVVRMYAGTRFSIHGKNFCVVNEDQVECTCLDPRGIGRA